MQLLCAHVKGDIFLQGSRKTPGSPSAGTSSSVTSTLVGEGDWTGPMQPALPWNSQVLWYCPWSGFRAWKRYGKVLPSPLPFWNHFAGVILRVHYLSGNHQTAWWEAEHPQPGWCPGLRLVLCLCRVLCGKLSALGHSSVPVPNVSLCPITALEIHKGNIWGLLGPSHLSGHFISHASGLVLNILDVY